jgi:predicted dehydrogenase
VDVYCNDAAYRLTMTPSKVMDTYFLDEDGIEDEVLGEMLPSKLGWNHAFVSDDVIRGYQGEMQDFMDCIAFDRDPAANFDVAYETARVMYAAYVSAEEGRRVDF